MPQQSRRCSAQTRDDRACRAWAVRGSSPPRCAAHGGRPQPGRSLPGRPERGRIQAGGTGALGSAGAFGNVGQVEVGDIDGVIHDLASKQMALSRLIDHCLDRDDLSIQELARLLAIHSQNASRLGRLLRDQQTLADPADDRFDEAINFALDALSEEWGVEL